MFDSGIRPLSVALLGVGVIVLTTQLSACGSPDATESNAQRHVAAAGSDDDLARHANAATSAPASNSSGLLPALSDEQVTRRLAREYGAVLVARAGSIPPPRIVFASEAEVTSWQSSLSVRRETLGTVPIELQEVAMKSLLAAIADAKAAGHLIKPRGTDAGRRNYADTVRLWRGRVERGLKHWVAQGKLSQADADRIEALQPFAQVPVILALEEQRKLYFSSDFARSILSSVAAPGSSQHLTLLAFDVEGHDNAKIRAILERHQWFQTVVDDTPHFTFLGASASELPSLGLEKVSKDGRDYWVPGTGGAGQP